MSHAVASTSSRAPRAHATRCRHRRTDARVVVRASAAPSDEETPESVLRVSRRTSFEGLKAARRVELQAARDAGDDERAAKVEWAFDALIAQSKTFFEERVKTDESPESRFMLGNFYQTLEKFDDAEREYRRALELGTNVDAANNLAMILQARGELDEAEAYYLKALEPDPDCVDVLFNWATLKLECRKDLNATRILIERIVTIQPDLKKHPLVKALRDDDDDDDDEPFIPPI